MAKKKTIAHEFNGMPENSAMGKLIKGILIIVVVIILFFGSMYRVEETEDAILTTFGKPTVVEESGLHFKIPFIQKVSTIGMHMRGMSIGYDEYGNSIENESLMITSDFNFVNVDFYIEYQVVDAVAASYNAEEPITILKALAISSIRDTVGVNTVDDVITTGKAEIQIAVKEKLARRVEEENIGVAIKSVTIQDAEPPTVEVSNAFKAVEDAKQNAETTINTAKKYNNEKVPAAEAEADKIIKTAEAEKQMRINEAQAQVAKFNETYAEYKKYPEVTKQRMYYEAMEELLPNLKVIIQNNNGDIVNVLSNGGIK